MRAAKLRMFVYVVSESPQGPCKIGLAENVKKRLATLQTGNHRKLTLAFEQATRSPHRAERMAHSKLIGQELSGEWFAVDEQTAITVLTKAIRWAEAVREESPYAAPEPSPFDLVHELGIT